MADTRVWTLSWKYLATKNSGSIVDVAMSFLTRIMAKGKLRYIGHGIGLLLFTLIHPGSFLLIYLVGIVTFTLTIHFLSPMADTIHRRPLGLETAWDLPSDLFSMCNVSDPKSWEYRACSQLISCYLDRLPELHKADIAIGTTLATLLPTIMVLISTGPNELVPQALVSPHRALAIGLFTVSPPTGMLRHLQPIQRGCLPEDQDSDGYERTWVVPLACITKNESHSHIAVKLVADVSILGLAATMFHRTWLVNVSTVVPWKCECPLLLFIWPLSCMFWLGFSVLLLVAMTEEIGFHNALLGQRANWVQVFLLPYAIGRAPRVGHDYCVRITARMPHGGRAAWIVNWRTYDLLTGVTAAAVYLYATFILSGSLFLGAVSAVRFTSIVSALHVGVRVIGGFL